MPTHVALLRGINVGGRNRVAMADLRVVVTCLAHTDVATYIQSGNVVFTSPETDTTAIAAALERAIAESLSVRPRVVVLSRDELSQVVADNPYPDETNPKCLHAAFTSTQIGPDQLAAIATAQRRATDKGSRDEATEVVARDPAQLAARPDVDVHAFDAGEHPPTAPRVNGLEVREVPSHDGRGVCAQLSQVIGGERGGGTDDV